jgi:ferredoxin/flavodoxin
MELVMRRYQRLKKIEIVYFSGTGGTKRVAATFVSELEKRGISVHSHEIHARNPYEPQAYDMLLVLYPVYAMNAPRPVYEFIDKLPMVERELAAVVSVSGGGEVIPNTASRLHCISQLKKKGYRVAYETMLIMPANCITPTPKELSLMLLKVLPSKVEKIVSDLLGGIVKRTEPVLVDRVISFFCETQKEGSKLYGKIIKADANCNGCGLCARACPMGNIKIRNSVPVYDNRCCLCLRCIYDCPKKALQPKLVRRFVFKDGYSLKELEKELPNYQPIDVNTYPFNIAFAGLKKYFLEQ